jgi:hypothetical protein
MTARDDEKEPAHGAPYFPEPRERAGGGAYRDPQNVPPLPPSPPAVAPAPVRIATHVEPPESARAGATRFLALEDRIARDQVKSNQEMNERVAEASKTIMLRIIAMLIGLSIVGAVTFVAPKSTWLAAVIIVFALVGGIWLFVLKLRSMARRLG